MSRKVSATENLATLLAVDLQKVATHFQKVTYFVQLRGLLLSRIKRPQVLLAQINHVKSHRIFKYQPTSCTFVLFV